MAETPMLKITSLTAETRRTLTAIEREQFPFALAKTLTETAEGAVQAVRMVTRRNFTLRSGEFIPKGVRKISAKKSDVKSVGIGKAVVFTQDRISGFMPIHEEGGVRTASVGQGNDKGKYLAQPGQALQKLAYRTGRGAVKKRYKPSTLLDDFQPRRLPPATFARVMKGQGIRRRKSMPFVIRGKKSGVPMIVRRVTNTPFPVEVLYVFSKRAKYKKQWRFEPTVKRYVDFAFVKKLKRNLRMAVETASRGM